jgi:hypothetical protein
MRGGLINMKKIFISLLLSIILGLTCLFGLSACYETQSPPLINDEPSSELVTVARADNYKIVRHTKTNVMYFFISGDLEPMLNADGTIMLYEEWLALNNEEN